MSDFDDIPYDQELEGSDDYESAFPDEDAEEIEEAIFRPALAMPELDEIQQSLEELLSDALKQHSKKDEIKGLRKAAKRQDLTKEDRAKLMEKIRSWEDTYEWNTESYIAMFKEDVCTFCASDTRHFEGFFYRQHHKTQKVSRTIRCSESQVYAQSDKNKFLPRVIMVRKESVPCCPMCVIGQGFPYSSIEVME